MKLQNPCLLEVHFDQRLQTKKQRRRGKIATSRVPMCTKRHAERGLKLSSEMRRLSSSFLDDTCPYITLFIEAV
jgi:hypothetical protein